MRGSGTSTTKLESFAEKVPRISYAHIQTRAVTHSLLLNVDQHLQTQTPYVMRLPLQNVVVGVRSVGVLVMTDVPVLQSETLVPIRIHNSHFYVEIKLFTRRRKDSSCLLATTCYVHAVVTAVHGVKTQN